MGTTDSGSVTKASVAPRKLFTIAAIGDVELYKIGCSMGGAKSREGKKGTGVIVKVSISAASIHSSGEKGDCC